MKHPRQIFMWAMLALFVLVFVACGTQETTKKEPVSKQSVQPSKVTAMRLAFGYPIVAVSGKRPQKKESEFQEWIEVSYPENSEHNIALTIVDSQGVEQELQGKIKVFQYTDYSKTEGDKKTLILVSPENPEYTYANILRNGYGEISVREYVNDPEKGKIQGPVMAQLFLGTKKKSDGQLEFRFREGSVYSVQGKTPPVSFHFRENSKQKLSLNLEEGGEIEGLLEVYQGNFYTSLAPVWVSLDDRIKDFLRPEGGSAALALYVPTPEYQKSDNVIMAVATNEDPAAVAKRYGAMVALLKLRRIK